MNMEQLFEQMNFGDDELVALASTFVNYAKDIAAHGDTSFLPVAHIVAVEIGGETTERENLHLVFADLPDNSDDRVKAFTELGSMLVNKGFLPLAIVFASEAWMSIAKMADDDGNPIKPEIAERPSEDPDRIEVHMIMGMTCSGRSITALHELRRKTDNTIVLVEYGKENLVVSDRTRRDSRLLSAFFTGSADAAMQKMLQNLLKMTSNDESATDNKG